jgi:hypothetical protein
VVIWEVVLLHDNSRPHKAMSIKECLSVRRGVIKTQCSFDNMGELDRKDFVVLLPDSECLTGEGWSLIPGESMSDLWWTERHRGRCFSRALRCLCNSTNAPESFKKQCPFDNRGTLDGKVLSLFSIQRNGKKGSIHRLGLLATSWSTALQNGCFQDNILIKLMIQH